MNNIRKIRIKKGITQTQLAEKVGCSIGYICHLEKGTRKNPSYNVMLKISQVLESDVKDVFGI